MFNKIPNHLQYEIAKRLSYYDLRTFLSLFPDNHPINEQQPIKDQLKLPLKWLDLKKQYLSAIQPIKDYHYIHGSQVDDKLAQVLKVIHKGEQRYRGQLILILGTDRLHENYVLLSSINDNNYNGGLYCHYEWEIFDGNELRGQLLDLEKPKTIVGDRITKFTTNKPFAELFPQKVCFNFYSNPLLSQKTRSFKDYLFTIHTIRKSLGLGCDLYDIFHPTTLWEIL